MFRSKNGSLILEIQRAALAEQPDVSSILRMAKVAASKLRQKDALRWIDLELGGYACSWEELPSYRRIYGNMRVDNPYNGLIPLQFESSELEEMMTRAPLMEGIHSLQRLIAADTGRSQLIHTMPPGRRKYLRDNMEIPLEPVLLLSKSHVENVLSKVTNLVLDWALELEAQGITGEGMSFEDGDSKKATPITQTIIAQNIGHLGDSTGNSGSSVQIESSGTQNLDQRELTNFISEAREIAALLPHDIQDSVTSKIVEVEDAKDNKERRARLLDLRSVLEGATGNIAAQGIIAAINNLL